MSLYSPDEKITALRKYLGFIEDGSAATIEIFQDDATKDFIIKHKGGNSWVYGKSLTETLERLVDLTKNW